MRFVDTHRKIEISSTIFRAKQQCSFATCHTRHGYVRISSATNWNDTRKTIENDYEMIWFHRVHSIQPLRHPSFERSPELRHSIIISSRTTCIYILHVTDWLSIYYKFFGVIKIQTKTYSYMFVCKMDGMTRICFAPYRYLTWYTSFESTHVKYSHLFYYYFFSHFALYGVPTTLTNNNTPNKQNAPFAFWNETKKRRT